MPKSKPYQHRECYRQKKQNHRRKFPNRRCRKVYQEPPATVPTEPAPEPAFDVGYWVDFAKAYAESVGLELDSEAVSCWDNPTIASSASRYLERDLCGLLNKYSRDADITAVWIWAEPRTESSWDIYIGYA